MINMKLFEVVRSLVNGDYKNKTVIYHHGEYTIRKKATELEKALPVEVLNREVIKTKDTEKAIHVFVYPDLKRHELY